MMHAVVQVIGYSLLMSLSNTFNQVIANSPKALEIVQKNGLSLVQDKPISLGNSLAKVLKWLWVGHHTGFISTGVDQLISAIYRY